MVEFMQFDDADEMLAWAAEQRAKVQARALAPEQEGIKYGDYAVRFLDGLYIFVYVEPPVGEAPDVMEHIEAKDKQENMLFCKCFSTLVVDGEYGWLHRSVLWPVEQMIFESADAVDWQYDRMSDETRLAIEMGVSSTRAVNPRG